VRGVVMSNLLFSVTYFIWITLKAHKYKI
jgi:hypothetical protein